MQGNNEICVFDMETGNKDLTLWASNTPPLSKPHVSVMIKQKKI